MKTSRQHGDAPHILHTDADGFAENTERAFLIVEISRRDIESGNIASVLERLLVMTDSRENALRYRESVSFVVRGFDFDPRELPEVSEVCAFFRTLSAEWPHWLWFLARGTGSLALVLSLLCQVRVIHGMDGAYGTEFIIPGEVEATLIDLLERGSCLFHAHAIPEELVDQCVESALAELAI